MTTSDRVYVWAWLPGSTEPVPCGVVVAHDHDRYTFAYGRSWLDRDAFPLYGLPLRPGPQADDLALPGALRDALPDAWGQRVVLHRLSGRGGTDADTADLSLMTYMRESGSDRFGAIDFQDSPDQYLPRAGSASLSDLVEAAEALEAGQPLHPAVADAFEHGTSVGGARPKVTLSDGDEHWIAKLSSRTDPRPVVRHEALALELARRAGVQTVDSRLDRVLGRDVLLVRRFDRGPGGTRRMAVSALTLLHLDELFGRYATYPGLLDALRSHPDQVDPGPELFARVALSIALGNTDDHARNHAALWDGQRLRLAPAYDLDPCRPHGWDANQAMAWGRDGQRTSRLPALVEAAHDYGLCRRAAREVVDHLVASIHDHWAEACDLARLSQHERELVWETTILNPGCHA